MSNMKQIYYLINELDQLQEDVRDINEVLGYPKGMIDVQNNLEAAKQAILRLI